MPKLTIIYGNVWFIADAFKLGDKTQIVYGKLHAVCFERKLNKTSSHLLYLDI